MTKWNKISLIHAMTQVNMLGKPNWLFFFLLETAPAVSPKSHYIKLCIEWLLFRHGRNNSMEVIFRHGRNSSWRL